MTATNRPTPSRSSAKPIDAVGRANRYIDGVLSGEIPACKWVKLACQRQRNDLADLPGYHFDAARANKVCRFVESLPHIKGSQFAG